jgi:hypothetical protein
MSIIQIGLVDTTSKLNPDLVQATAAALNIQVTRDLPQFWPVQATVQYLPHATKIPAGVWPVQLVPSLPPPEGGFHLTKHNQPYAKVIATPDDDSWTIDASHETIEMLVDPSGNKMQSSTSIEISGNGVVDGTSQFNYLVEACDPCEANNYAYDIAGIAVSDFITPHFYDASVTPDTRYSFKGNIKRPRQMLPGGYISYIQADGTWNQILWVDPSQPPQYNNLGPSGAVRSLREAVHAEMGAKLDALKHERRRDPSTLPSGLAARVAQHRERLSRSAERASLVTARYEL